MPRGRPPNSEIRQRLVEILAKLGKDYGYNIYKLYTQIFPKVSMRVIYYHLNKGVELGIFKAEKVLVNDTHYSWGETAERVYYSLGKDAMPLGDSTVDSFFESKNSKKLFYPWHKDQQQQNEQTDFVR